MAKSRRKRTPKTVLKLPDLATRNLTVDECPVPRQSSPTTVQFRAFLVVNLSINLDGK